MSDEQSRTIEFHELFNVELFDDNMKQQVGAKWERSCCVDWQGKGRSNS